MEFLILFLILGSSLRTIDGTSRFTLGEPLLHHVQLDQFGTYHLLWSPKEEEIVFEVQVKTTGYVGLGFSPTGGMDGADIYIGWIDAEGKVILTDRHALGQRTPTLDPSQDFVLHGGYKNETHTVIRFSRPWISCDKDHDMDITDDTMRVIWAYDAMTPDPTKTTLSYHDHRGTKSLYLRESKLPRPPDFDENNFWEIRAPNVHVPQNLSTLYWCSLYKVPDLRRKAQMIGYKPILEQKGSSANVHHMLLYECSLENSHEHLEKWVGSKGAQCYERNMPISWISCNTPIVAWGIGSEGEMMPNNVGFPLGEDHGGANYFLLETHYDNPKLEKDIVDNSGLRLFLTNRPRQHDASAITVGHKVEPSMIIPPGKVWSTTAHCTSDCTRKMIPPEGIIVISGVLHAHLLGRSISLQQIRDDVELEPLIKDDYYDFNYQQSRFFKEEKTILPGDHLITTCKYDSTKKTKPTFGGFSTDDEMCLVFLMYYPKVNWSECYSRPDLAMLFTIFGIRDLHNNLGIMRMFSDDDFHPSYIDSQQEDEQVKQLTDQNSPPGTNASSFRMVDFFRMVHISEPAALRGKSFYDLLTKDSTWKNSDLVSELMNAATNLTYEPKCLYHGRGAVSGVAMKSKVPSYFSYKGTKETCRKPQIRYKEDKTEEDPIEQQEKSKLVQPNFRGRTSSTTQKPITESMQEIPLHRSDFDRSGTTHPLLSWCSVFIILNAIQDNAFALLYAIY